jgi:hypothetical protein
MAQADPTTGPITAVNAKHDAETLFQALRTAIGDSPLARAALMRPGGADPIGYVISSGDDYILDSPGWNGRLLHLRAVAGKLARQGIGPLDVRPILEAPEEESEESDGGGSE